MTQALLELHDLIGFPYEAKDEPLVAANHSPERDWLFSQRISPREMQVLAEAAAHGGNEAAAHCVGVSTQTVKNHLSSVYAKLGASSLGQALWLVGWLQIPDQIPQHRRHGP